MQLGDGIKGLLRGTCLEYWLLDNEGQVGTMILSVLLVTFVWLIWLEYQGRKSRNIVVVEYINEDEIVEQDVAEQADGMFEEDFVAELDEEEDGYEENEDDDDILSSIETENDQSTSHQDCDSSPEPAPSVETSSLSPSPFLRPFAWSRSDKHSTAVTTGFPHKHLYPRPQRGPLPADIISFTIRTGLQSSPGYQTPSHDKTQLSTTSDNTDVHKFLHLEKEAPVSWNTLRKIGMLDSEGTPTKKWKASRLRRTVRRSVYGVEMSSDRVEGE